MEQAATHMHESFSTRLTRMHTHEFLHAHISGGLGRKTTACWTQNSGVWVKGTWHFTMWFCTKNNKNKNARGVLENASGRLCGAQSEWLGGSWNCLHSELLCLQGANLLQTPGFVVLVVF